MSGETGNAKKDVTAKLNVLLTQRQIEILSWHYFDNLTYREIGELLGVSHTTALNQAKIAIGILSGMGIEIQEPERGEHQRVRYIDPEKLDRRIRG